MLLSPLPSVEVSSATGELAQIVAITAYDPLGDNEENAEQALLAIDGDLETAWTTVNYRQADMSGKAGVGLLLDLGTSQDVYGVDVEFTAIGHSGEIYVIDSPVPDFVTAPKFGDVDPTKSSSAIEVTDAVSGRYVLVWLIPDVPKSETDEFQGGISEIKVRL